MKLIEVFEKLDKPSTKWTGYFPVYDRHLGKFVGKSPKILEIGILGGGSLDMWHRYFGDGTKVYGIDIDERCYQYATQNTEIVIGDQASPDFWNSFSTTMVILISSLMMVATGCCNRLPL